MNLASADRLREQPGSAWRTTALVALLAGAALVASWQLTAGFTSFTSEELRRLGVSTNPPELSAIELVTAQSGLEVPWARDGDPHRVYLVHFMYTRCPAVCRVQGSEFAQMQASLRIDPAPNIRLYAVSFDPQVDTPAQLASYAKANQADAAILRVVTAHDPAKLPRLLTEAGVVVIPDGAGGFAHNAAIHVVLGSGRLIRIFDYDQHREALSFARSLAG
jgi:protein SCO1/2